MGRWLAMSALLTGCAVQNGGWEAPEPDLFCESAADVAIVVAQACQGAISQPASAYPENGVLLERWLALDHGADHEAVIAGREACIPARPWAEAPVDMGVDCNALSDCLSGEGVVFPAPWPEGDFLEPSDCFDPDAVDGE